MTDDQVYKEDGRKEKTKPSDEHFDSAVCGSGMFAESYRGTAKLGEAIEDVKRPRDPLFRFGAGRVKYNGRDDFLNDFEKAFEGRFLSYIELTMRNVESFGGVIELPGVYHISRSGKEVKGTITVGEEQKSYIWELPVEVST